MDVTIYSYRVWDNRSGAYVILPRMVTREFIERAKGEVFEDSAKTRR